MKKVIEKKKATKNVINTPDQNVLQSKGDRLLTRVVSKGQAAENP